MSVIQTDGEAAKRLRQMLMDANESGYVSFEAIEGLIGQEPIDDSELDKLLAVLEEHGVELRGPVRSAGQPRPAAPGIVWHEPADVTFEEEALEVYKREVAKVPITTVEAEAELSRRMKAGGQDGEVAERALLEAYLWLVLRIAVDYEGADVHILDLVQQGNEGLLRAVRRFDPVRSATFRSHAAFWVHRELWGFSGFKKVVPVHLKKR